MKLPFSLRLVGLAFASTAYFAVLAQQASAAQGAQAHQEAKDGFEEGPAGEPGAAVPMVLANHDASHAVTVSWNGSTLILTNGGRTGPWTLIDVFGEGEERIGVFEDLRLENGRIVFVRQNSVVADLSKSLEPIFPLEP